MGNHEPWTSMIVSPARVDVPLNNYIDERFDLRLSTIQVGASIPEGMLQPWSLDVDPCFP